MIELLKEMFAFIVVQRALIVGALVVPCSAVLGVSLVLKRYSMIGDGLSHVGFAALAGASAIGFPFQIPVAAGTLLAAFANNGILTLSPLLVCIPVIVVSAVLLLRVSESHRIKGDAAIALISCGALAVGVIIVYATTGSNTDVCNYMFGNILSISQSDMTLSIIFSTLILVLYVLFYNKIFAVTFDESFAKATGTNAGAYNLIIATLTAVIVALGMRIMGAMLISSLIVFPALTSMRVCKNFKSVIICSVIVAEVCFFVGMIFSMLVEVPSGAAIVVVNILALLGFALYSFIRRRVKK